MPINPSNPASSPSKESNDSHSSQGNSHTADQSQKATSFDFISKGPQIPDNMPPRVPREEIDARMKELNKK